MTDHLSRRTAVKALGMGAVAMAASETAQAQAPEPAKVPAFVGNHQPKPLKFDPVALGK
jgi:Fe-Mn family superoxide dismutase